MFNVEQSALLAVCEAYLCLIRRLPHACRTVLLVRLISRCKMLGYFVCDGLRLQFRTLISTPVDPTEKTLEVEHVPYLRLR